MNLNDTIYPLSNFVEVYTLLYLLNETDIVDDWNILTDIFNKINTTKYDKSTLEAAVSKFDFLKIVDSKLLKKKHDLIKDELSKFPERVKCPVQSCHECSSILETTETKSINTFNLECANHKLYEFKKCNNCTRKFDIEKWSLNSNVNYYKNFQFSYCFLSTETAFDLKLIKDFDIHLLVNGISFKGKLLNFKFNNLNYL